MKCEIMIETGNNICQEEHKEGYLCNLESRHIGKHHAHGGGKECIKIWEKK